MEFLTLNAEIANNAYRAISFSPEKRAKSLINDFNEDLRTNYKELETLASSEPQKIVLNEEFKQYQQIYKIKYESFLTAKGRTMSPMITGPANFPVRSNEKKINSERKRYEEFTEWQKKAYKSILNKINGARTQEQIKKDLINSENKSLEYILKEAVSVIKSINGDLPYSPALLKGALERRIMNIAKINPALGLKAVNEVNLLSQDKIKKDVFTNRHKIYKAIETIKETLNKPVEILENETLGSYGWAKVINNFEAERVQFLFDAKPPEDIRNILKSNGFRWSPRYMAWQRQNTFNGLYSTKQVINLLTQKDNG